MLRCIFFIEDLRVNINAVSGLLPLRRRNKHIYVLKMRMLSLAKFLENVERMKPFVLLRYNELTFASVYETP